MLTADWSLRIDHCGGCAAGRHAGMRGSLILRRLSAYSACRRASATRAARIEMPVAAPALAVEAEAAVANEGEVGAVCGGERNGRGETSDAGGPLTAWVGHCGGAERGGDG